MEIPTKTFNRHDDPHGIAARAAIAWNARQCGLSDPGTEAFWANEEIYLPGDAPQYRFLEALLGHFGEDIRVYRLPAPSEAGISRGTRLLVVTPDGQAHVVWLERGVWLDPE